MPLSNSPNGFLLTTNHCCFLLCFQYWCQVVSGWRHVAIMSVEHVGNYGIRLAFVGKMLVSLIPMWFILGVLNFWLFWCGKTGLLLMTYTTQGYICGTFFTLLVNSNFIGCGGTSKLWNIKALAKTHPERSECSCKVTILFQGMFFCYMLPTSGCHRLSHFMWALSGSGVGTISFSMWWLHLRLWRRKPHIYKEIVSLCLCTNPKPLKMAFMNTLNYVFMKMPSLSKWKYMLACFRTPLITTILCPLSVIACDGKAYV